MPTAVENGKKTTKFSSVEELKNQPLPNVVVNNKTLDSSPLLDRTNGKPIMVVPKSETNESVATTTTTTNCSVISDNVKE